MAKGNTGGKHAVGRQQTTGKTARAGAGRGKGLFSRSMGKHTGKTGGGKSGGDARGGAADGLDRWG